MSDHPGSPIQRVAQRLRNISQLSTQIATVEVQDAKISKLWPDNMRVIADSLVDAGETLKRYASEISTYTGRRLEDTDALVTLAQTAANIATVLGSDGQNLEILTHSDPEFIYGVLSKGLESYPAALEKAVSRLGPAERERLARWLK